MSVLSRSRWPILAGFVGLALTVAVVLALASPGSAFASVSLTQISSDPFNASSCTASNTTNHFTEVEPDTYSSGSTIVSAFQEGRIFDGGACDVGFATSTNNGSTWTTGSLPGITTHFGGGSFARATDPSVAYDAAHGAWLVSSLPLTETGGVKGVEVVDSRSTDGGLTWSNPFVTENTSSSPDKNWIACDDTATSPFYGHCYTEWDDNGAGNKDWNSFSTDGGQTWSAPKSTRPASSVIGGQPLVQPNGTVAVPIDNANETALGIYSSTNGGSSWSSAKTITSISHHTLGGNLREGPLPSAEVDGGGTVYVVWSDCRFRSGCTSNDLVMAKSSNLTSWTITQIPITLGTGAQDYVIPGIAVDKGTSGGSAHLVVTFYYQSASCNSITNCVLNVGSVSSTNGGSSWGSATTLTSSGMQQNWLATTSQGYMVGDYISTSFGSTGTAFGVFANATASTGGNCGSSANNCNEPMDTTTSGQALAAGSIPAAGGSEVHVGASGNNGADWVLAADTGLSHSH